MDETKKKLRAIINGQSALRDELLGAIKGLDKKLSGRKDDLEKGIKKANKRIDSIGRQLAYLDDDVPSGEECKALSERVAKIEQKIVSYV